MARTALAPLDLHQFWYLLLCGDILWLDEYDCLLLMLLHLQCSLLKQLPVLLSLLLNGNWWATQWSLISNFPAHTGDLQVGLHPLLYHLGRQSVQLQFWLLLGETFVCERGISAQPNLKRLSIPTVVVTDRCSRLISHCRVVLRTMGGSICSGVLSETCDCLHKRGLLEFADLAGAASR